jgi:ribulose-phosphate 3-epimerase
MKQCGPGTRILNNLLTDIMPSKKLIAASLICADPLHLDSDLREIIDGGADWIHFDVMDGNFVPRYGLYPEILAHIRKFSSLPVDVHMMVANPERYVDQFSKVGATHFCFHIEAVTHPHRLIKEIQANGMIPGVALNPGTALSTLDWIINDIAFVCLMAINPGIVGHKIIPNVYKKITALREYSIKNGNPDLLIEIDGGVTMETANTMVNSGADVLVCGSGSIFRPHEDSVSNKIRLIRSKIYEQ